MPEHNDPCKHLWQLQDVDRVNYVYWCPFCNAEKVDLQNNNARSERDMSTKPFYYALTMFPHPSDKLHLDHWYNYAPVDTFARFKRLKGYEVFQPMGFDAFGLPAENYARQTGIHPKKSTEQNILSMMDQFDSMGTMFSWDNLVITSDPEYYKWTQWLFVKLSQHGLTYRKEALVNWCDKCKTVNEQCQDEKCERCGNIIQWESLKQWYVRITEYNDKLIQGLEQLGGWPIETVNMQRKWLEKKQDWCVSRQRYWGTPIPIVYDSYGASKYVQTNELPWKLPEDVTDFTTDGKRGPNARSKELAERAATYGYGYTPEFDTLDTFMDSSFYWLRYLCQSDKELITPELGINSKANLCVVGAEHACKHLIYARFIYRFLSDNGYVVFKEPFERLVHQGVITKDGKKMSNGNAISPDKYVKEYGTDVLRLYLMFIGPYAKGGEWNDKHIAGVNNFLTNFYDWVDTNWSCTELVDGNIQCVPDQDIAELVIKVERCLKDFKLNIGISHFMKFLKEHEDSIISRENIERLIIAFAPFAPKTAEIMWSIENKTTLWQQDWPDPKNMPKSKIRLLLIQENGDFKGQDVLSGNEDKEQITQMAKSKIGIDKWDRVLVMDTDKSGGGSKPVIVNFITK